MKYSVLVAFSLICLNGCSQQPPTPGASPVSIAPSPALQPIKEVAKEVEEAGLQFKEAREESVKKEVEALKKKDEALRETFSEARQRRDWEAVQESAQKLLESRKELLELVSSKSLDKHLARAHRDLAQAYLENGQPAAAEEHLLKALHAAHRDSEKNDLRSELFRLYSETRNFDKAEDMGRQALEAASDKSNKRGWKLRLASLATKQKDIGDARKLLGEVRKELDQEATSMDNLEQQMECCEVESDIAWANEDRIAVAEIGIRRSELQKKRYELRLKEAKAKYDR